MKVQKREIEKAHNLSASPTSKFLFVGVAFQLIYAELGEVGSTFDVILGFC